MSLACAASRKNSNFIAICGVVAALSSVILAGAGCRKKEQAKTSSNAVVSDAASVNAGAPLPKGAVANGLRFIEEDVEAAQREAVSTQKLLFVDAWAPWCHTCLSMKHYVFSAPELAPLASTAVFASLNTERSESAPFLARYRVAVLPTFFLIHPESRKIVGRWQGSATVEQIRTFVEGAKSGIILAARPGDPAVENPSADTILATAISLIINQQHAEGREFLEKLLAVAPSGNAADGGAPSAWPRRSEALIALLEEYGKAGKPAVCVDFALRELLQVSWSSLAADFASIALDCADELDAANKNVVSDRSRKLREQVVSLLARLTADTDAPLTEDDRGDAYRILADAREKLGDKVGAKNANEMRVDRLALAAAAAPNAEAASTYDGSRADALLTLGRGEEAVALLQKSEAVLPKDYNPPARLARVLHLLGRNAEARAAIDRALGLAYGPRKMGFFKLKAEILSKLGEQAAVIATLEDEVAGYAALPEGQKKSSRQKDAELRLAAAKAPAELRTDKKTK